MFQVMIKIAVWETQEPELTDSFHIGRRATNIKPPTPQSISHYWNTKGNKNLLRSYEYKSSCRQKYVWEI